MRNQLEYWINKYSEYSITKEMKEPYHQYTIEEIQNIDFGYKNAIIFLEGENGMTLYEEGMLNNGLNKNNTFQKESQKDLASIIKNCVNGGKEVLHSYSRFRRTIKETTASAHGLMPSKRLNPFKVAGHNLERLSEATSAARVTIINLSQMPEINKKKIGILPNNTVILVIGAHEVGKSSNETYYSAMRREAFENEEKIKTIIDAFENPQTPKETLLKYIANSYGLLEKILGGEPPQPQQPKRGGKQQ